MNKIICNIIVYRMEKLMKKIIICLAVLLSFNNVYALDYMSYCPAEKQSTSFLGNIASITGVNFLNRILLQNRLASAVKKETNSKFDINIESIFGSSVLSGAFKSLSAKSSSVGYKGIYMSDFSVNTVCPYNYVSFKDGKLSFPETLVLNYKTSITQEDIDKILNSDLYKNAIKKMNKDSSISSLVNITSSKVTISDGKLNFKYKLTPFPNAGGLISQLTSSIKPISLSFSTNLRAKNGKLELCNYDVNSKSIGYEAILPIVNKLNPLNNGVNVGKNARGTFDVQNANIKDGKIQLDGVLMISKTE